jgi:F-type H+-transporting ATPase subunit beta
MQVVIEVLQILEDNVVRGIAMDSTDGLRKGDEVKNTHEPIKVPVGKEVLGHVFNALGQPLDTPSLMKGNEEGTDNISTTLPSPTFKKREAIHRSAPHFTKLSTKQEILETGIKVIDLLAPILKGGKV